MIKISSETQKELICLCGLCDHDCLDNGCLYNQLIDKPKPEEDLYKRIISLMRKEVARNINKSSHGTVKR